MRAMILFGCVLVTACSASNQVCRSTTTEIVGECLATLDLRPSTVRMRESAAGNLLADALLAEVPGADVALVPAILFSQETSCGRREYLSRGQLTQTDVDELVPAPDNVILVHATTDDLRRVLEHSVSRLNTSLAEFPLFLHVAGLTFTADCAEPPQTLTADGREILFTGSRVSAVSIMLRGVPPVTGQMLKVATVASMSLPTSGYIDLSRDGRVIEDTGRTPRELLAEHLRRKSPVDPKLEGRMVLKDSCILD
ncbi:MAG: 5'-nucleotidase C-terminal domain-containing protein [Deltaproteobacteria bacterium]|nr:5'-nucleotidase C-terminal domain-containing protein [Deltaproteobacteria bacterium]